MKPQFGTIWNGTVNLRCKVCLVALAMAGLWPSQPLRAAALTDFGYQNSKVNGHLTLGTRPLLAIFVNFDGQVPLPQSISYYSNLVFNTSLPQSMAGYYQASSDGAFSIVPGGAIMLSLAGSETRSNFNFSTNDFITAGAYASNIVAEAMISGQFNFASYASYDPNGIGHITQDQLAIMIVVSDDSFLSGGARTMPVVSVPGYNYDWGSVNLQPIQPYPNVAILGSPGPGTQAPFIVWCEELEETWGAKDIYSTFADGSAQCLSKTLSPQSCWYENDTFIGAYYYLDPWNRMEFGWCQPRIFSLTEGGITTLTAAQTGDPTSPIILYDPVRGTNEFFMLEYRTSTNVVYGPGYDNDVGNLHDVHHPVSSGLVIWHVQLDSNHYYFKVTSPSGVTNTDSVWAEGSPNLIPSDVPSLWGSNSTTPNLKWMDGTPTLTTVHVRPFSLGDNSITVEWLSAEDTWVDFNFTGAQSGTFANPYNTMAAGIAAVSYGGILHVKTGTSSETPTISKPMQMVGYNGPATIGN